MILKSTWGTREEIEKFAKKLYSPKQIVQINNVGSSLYVLWYWEVPR